MLAISLGCGVSPRTLGVGVVPQLPSQPVDAVSGPSTKRSSQSSENLLFLLSVLDRDPFASGVFEFF